MRTEPLRVSAMSPTSATTQTMPAPCVSILPVVTADEVMVWGIADCVMAMLLTISCIVCFPFQVKREKSGLPEGRQRQPAGARGLRLYFYDTANFISLMASKLMTSPPTRLVV